MPYKLIVLDSAYAEIDNIAHYIKVNLGSPIAASDFLDELFYQLNLVCENPYIFAVSNFPKLKALSYRVFFVKKYIGLYKVVEDAVVFAHIFHQTQDYANLV
jgi:plasmid stabilization system protein ParE